MRGVILAARRLPPWLVVGVALSLVGCGRESGTPSAASECGGMTSREFLRLVAGPIAAEEATEHCCSGKPEVPEATPVQDKAAEVKLDVIKYEPLVEAIRAQRGHVVVIDFWGDFCIPCKREFPNLVKLQKRHAQDGVVCMSLSVDPVERREAALNFLKAQKAAFPNYLLDEDASVWQSKWNLSTVPAVLVFYRDGTRAGKFDDDDPDHPFTYEDVERLVEWVLRTEQ
jgi:thiol-disulfide isomerase/thioredoxin